MNPNLKFIIYKNENINKSDIIIGPLIPRNFETFSNIKILETIPKVFPLSTIPIQIIKGVVQTVTPRKLLRESMLSYLHKNIDREENIVIIADSLNQEIESKKLIDYIGLEWDDNCLKPENNKRSVNTASNIQIRKKIYKGSSDKWKKYKPFLNGVLDNL